jgi:circadian clock protein KaiB
MGEEPTMAEEAPGDTCPREEVTRPTYRLHLFVAGDAPNSRRARENLHRICERHLAGNYEIAVTDVFEDAAMAIERNVFITPALLVEAPAPKATVFGNLTDRRKVLAALGLGDISDG